MSGSYDIRLLTFFPATSFRRISSKYQHRQTFHWWEDSHRTVRYFEFNATSYHDVRIQPDLQAVLMQSQPVCEWKRA